MSDTNSFRSQELATDPPPASGDATAKILDPSGHALGERLGIGGMGEVYRFGDEALQRDLAIKILKEELRGNADAEERFLREARLTGSLQHPGVVPIHNLSRLADGRPCYTMKLVRGRTFADMLRDEPQGPERLPRLLAILEKICQAVAYAHSKHVIHRDLKPSNVMVGEFGEVQVMDWGLAKELHLSEPEPPPEATEEVETAAWTKEADGLSRAGSALGTPAYMPPEQAAGDWDIVDERADVFALGAILCEMLTGHPPYHGANREDLLRRARRGDMAEALSRLAKCGVDAVLVDLCRECLAAERLQRPRQAGVVAEQLAAYQAEVRERLRQAELQRARAEVKMLEERKRRRLLAALALLVLLVLLGAGGGVWWLQQQRARTDQAVSNALAQAELLAEQAQADPLQTDKYRQALELARGAVELAQTASAGSRQKAEDRVARLQQDEAAARKDRQLLAALLDVRGPREGPKYQSEPNGMMMAVAEPTADEQFAAAFRRWGLDVDGTAPEEAKSLLKARPPVVVTEVIAALDEWASERRRQSKDKQQWQRLVELAALLDADPGSKRRELRQIMARGRLPLERALDVLSAAMRPVPLPVGIALGPDRQRLRQLAEQTNAAREPILGLLTLGRALIMAGERARAEQLLRAAIVARPREVVLHHSLGELLASQQPPRWTEAVECYGAARTLRPDLGVILATVLLESGRDGEGLALLARLVSESPTNPYLHFQLAYALSHKGRLDEGIAEYRQAIALEPKMAWAHTILGNALREKGQLDEAVAECRRAIDLEPKDAKLHTNLGVALSVKRQLGEAMAEYRLAIDLDPKLAQPHNNLGVVLRAKGRLDEAVAEFHQAIDLEPKDAEAHYNLGLALHDKGRLDEAMAEYRKAIALDPKHALSHNKLGVIFCDHLRDYDRAIACFRQTIELDPKDASFHFNLGNALRGKGRLEEAMAEYHRAIDLDPKGAEAHYNLGIVLYDKGLLDAAVAEYRQAIALDPKHATAHNNLGLALQAKGQVDEAVAEYRQAIALDPTLAQPHYNLGKALYAKGKFDDAMSEYRLAIALNPKDANAHHNLGFALHHKRQLDEAVAEYRLAIDLDPKDATAHYNLGLALDGKGRVDEAIGEYRKTIDLDPKYVEAHNSLGAALYAKGQLEEAMAEWRRAIDLDPKLAKAHSNLGNALRAKEQLDEAVAEYRKAIDLDPKYATAHNNLGDALYDKGRLDESMAEYRQAIRLKPDYAEAHCNLGDVLQQQGRFEQALASLRRGHELGSKQSGWRYPSAEWVREAERLLALDKKLPAVLSGQAAPANPAEAVALAWMCQQPYKKRYVAAARLCADALAADPKLAADLQQENRYNAAWSAALAAAGQGEDARSLPDRVAVMFRRWALGWLRDDLTDYAKLAEPNDPAVNKTIQQTLAHWRRDADLASVRDPQALDRLPDDERAAWQALWRDVDELAKRAAKQSTAGEQREKQGETKNAQKNSRK